jgi:hypothetical protein
LTASKGAVDWRWRLGARVIGAPVTDGERVFVVAVDNVVRGLSRGSGNQRWKYALTTRALAGPLLADGLIIITTGEVGHPGLTYIQPDKGAAAGRTPPLATLDETMRVQFPAIVTRGASPRALLATATPAGDWTIHGYRQTFLQAAAGTIAFGKKFEIRQRLDIVTGVRAFGVRVFLFGNPLVPLVPKAP